MEVFMFDVSVVLQTVIALIALLTGIGFVVRLLLAPIKENQIRMEAELKSNQARMEEDIKSMKTRMVRMEGEIKDLKVLLTRFLENNSKAAQSS